VDPGEPLAGTAALYLIVRADGRHARQKPLPGRRTGRAQRLHCLWPEDARMSGKKKNSGSSGSQQTGQGNKGKGKGK
jgi:hypothetical protein